MFSANRFEHKRYFDDELAASQFRNEVLAEGAGFEPAIRFPVYTLSKRAP
jgi:hypothetical protein